MHTYRSTWTSVAAFLGGCGLILIGLGGLLAGEELSTLDALVIVGAIAVGLSMAYAAVTPQVIASNEGVRVRRSLLSVTIRWVDIERFDLIRVWPFEWLAVKKRDGRIVQCRPLRNLSRKGVVSDAAQVASSLNDLLRIEREQS